MKNLNQNLMRLSVVLLGLGMLAAVGCESCTPSSPTTEIPANTSYRCGPGTHLVGLQCVNNAGPAPGNTAPVGTVPLADN
jgi:hypothetical protein